MFLLSELRERFRALLFRAREDRELEEELAFHLEQQTEANIARGMKPEEARRQAHLALGGLAQIREATRDARGVRWLDDFAADVRYALRTFVRSLGFTLSAVLTLGLGIGAVTAIYSVVHPLLLDPLPFEGGDRLARLWYADPRSGMSITPHTPVSEAWQRDARPIEMIEEYAYSEFRHGGPDGVELVSGIRVSHRFLDLLGLRPALGRWFGSDEMSEDADVVLLGYGYWKRAYGGRADVVGQTIELDGRRRTIIGVVPAKLAAFEARDIWAPLHPTPGCETMGCGMLLARLRPGVSDAVAEGERTAIAARVVETEGLGADWGEWGARLVRPRDELATGLRGALRVVAVAVGLVLLVGAGLLTRGLIRLQATDPGFRSEGLYSVQVVLPEAVFASESSRAALRAELLERLRGMPGIEAATIVSSAPPHYGFMRGAPEAEGGERVDEVTLVSAARVHADYFATAGIPILEGRGSRRPRSRRRRPSSCSAIGPRGASGRRAARSGGGCASTRRGGWLTVVGVAGEIAAQGGLLRSGPSRLQAHQPFSEFSARLPRLGVLPVRAAGPDDAVAARIRAFFRAVAPDVAIREIASVDAQLDRTLAGPRFNAALLSAFATLALLLAAVGLYGVLAYAVRRQKREIGIRKAVGAPRGEIVRSVVGEALTPVAIGTALGLAGALAAGRVIESQLYGFPARDPLTFVAVVGVMLATALVAALIPVRLATRVDPMVALRAE